MKEDTKKTLTAILLMVLMLGCMFGFIITTFITMQNHEEELNKQCQRLGFVEFKKAYANYDFCVDRNRNYHYIESECEGFFDVHCNINLISVGDVRVRN